MPLVPVKSLVRKERKAFCLAESLRQTKNFYLCVLGVSAVKMLFWPSMNHYTENMPPVQRFLTAKNPKMP